MRIIMKLAFVLSLLLLMANPALAQESTKISLVGSGLVNPLIEALAERAAQVTLDIKTVGTATGIDRFCNGEIDLATAIRPMSAAEKAICGSNEVVYSELIIGHHIVAFVAHADAPLECLTESQAQAILKPSASAVATDWSFSGAEENDLPLTLILPSSGQIAFAIADDFVPGDGLRRDASRYEDAADALALAGEAEGALAMLSWYESLAEMDSVALLTYSSGESGECALPSAENVEQERYGAALSLVVYVNRRRLASNQQLADLLRFATDETNQDVIRKLGPTPPSEAAYIMNASRLKDEATRVDDSNFQIPAALTGILRIVGAASGADMLNRAATALTQDNEALEINLDFAGRASGLASLCAGEADIALLDAGLADGDLDDCAARNVSTVPTRLGSRATVLIGNAADEHTRCLTTDQVNTLWRAESAGIVTDWSGVDPAFPNMSITLFGTTLLNEFTDILLQTADDVIPPIRRDTEQDYNPLYRAAAVGNVPGALTYMNWPNFQRVLENGQANIQLAAVDGGAGCVTPSPATIEDGSYALSRPLSLLIRQESLSGINTQSYLWTLFDADDWLSVEQAGIVGLSALDLPFVRLELQRSFAEAEATFPTTDGVNDSATDGDDLPDESTDADSG